MTGKHFAWHKRWSVDLAKNTANHDNGLVVAFVRSKDDDRAWDGATEAANINATFAILTAQHGAGNAASMLARLMREAGEVFQRAKSKPKLP